MPGEEIQETRAEETIRDLGVVYKRVEGHVLAVAEHLEARTAHIANGGLDAEFEVDADIRGHSKDLVNDLVLLQRIINRVEHAPDMTAGFPTDAVKENVETAIRRSLKVARMVRGVKVPPDEEVMAVAANSDPLLWADQHERLSAFSGRAQALIDEVQACFDRLDEHGMVLGVANMDDFIEQLDSDDGLLGRPQTVQLRQLVANGREELAAALSEVSTTGHVIARRWTTSDDV